MQDDRLGREGSQTRTGELVLLFVLVEVKLEPGKALGLDAEHHDDLGAAKGGFKAALNLDSGASARSQLRKQLFGTAKNHLGTEARQQEHVGAGDATVQDVTNNGDGDAVQRMLVDLGNAGAKVSEDGAQIEQGLGRMLVHTVASIDDWKPGFAFQQPGGTRGVVAQDDGLGAKGSQGEAGVFERLAFFDAGREAGDKCRVRAERFGGQLKAGTGAGGRLIKQERYAPLGQDVVADERVRLLQFSGPFKQVAEVFDAQIVDRKQGTWIVRE